MLGSGWSGPGLSPGEDHCVVFLDKTLLSSVPLFMWQLTMQPWAQCG